MTLRIYLRASQVVLVVKNLPVSSGDLRDGSSIPRQERFPGGGCDDPFQCSCLENPMEQRSLVGCKVVLWVAKKNIPLGCKESDMTEAT